MGAITCINPLFCTAEFCGDYGFDRFLARGGAATEEETADFVREFLGSADGLHFSAAGMGCSTMQAKGPDGCFFGRNFDWGDCPLLVLTSHPRTCFASISSVNLDFIRKRNGDLPEAQLLAAAHYGPLDGMNEKGLCVSVNLLPDGMPLRQDTGKPKLTITTALRLLLDQAATAEEAVRLLEAYDLGTSTGLTIHYLISDAKGHSLCVEYIHNVMSVIETPVMTNHYLTPGPYFGQARNNSVERYGLLTDFLARTPAPTAEDVRAAMAEVYHGTQWTAVYDQTALTALIYHKDCRETPLFRSLFSDFNAKIPHF